MSTFHPAPFLAAATLLVALLCIGVVLWKLRTREDVSPVLVLTCAVYTVLWVAFPLLFAMVRPAQSDYRALDADYLNLALLHVLLWTAVLTIFLCIRRPQLRTLMRGPAGIELSPRMVIALLVGGTLLSMQLSLASLRGAAFSEIVAFVMQAGAQDLARAGIYETVRVLTLGVAMAAVTYMWPPGREGRIVVMVGWGVILMYVMGNFAQGMRAVILLPAVVLVASLWARRGAVTVRQRLLVVGLLTATVVAAPLLAAAAAIVRMNSRDRLDAESLRQGYTVAVSGASTEDKVNLASRQLYTKLDSYRTGVVLLDVEGRWAAGWAPITSALLSPVPRIIFPSKPVPTSRNGRYSGTPYRIVGDQHASAELGMVAPVSAVAITLWELGTGGLVLFVAANIGFLLLLNSLLCCPSILHRALAFGLLGLPTAEFMFNSISNIVRDGLRALLFLLLLNGAILLARHARAVLSSSRPRTAAALDAAIEGNHA